MSVEYKKTVILPKTDFPMRAGLPKMEPTLLEQWAKEDLYGKIRGISADREMFVLHDGPPYANGHLHIGHALNKILKDVITRSQQMLGKNAVYVPGWDCHGLPIEWKIEEQYRAKGKNKDDVPIAEFRKECREFAQKWLDIQREEFKRLGVMGDWDNPYVTMDYKAEASIARELGKFLMNGSLYMGSKPVMWSVVEKNRPGRGRGRISRPHQQNDPCPVPGCFIQGRRPFRCDDPDLDHNPMDDPRQPRDFVRGRDRLCRDRSDRNRRRSLGQGRRENGDLCRSGRRRL